MIICHNIVIMSYLCRLANSIFIWRILILRNLRKGIYVASLYSLLEAMFL